MNKTELRVILTKATNGARNLKNVGLSPAYYWHPTHMLAVARDLREAAEAIEVYLNTGGKS